MIGRVNEFMRILRNTGILSVSYAMRPTFLSLDASNVHNHNHNPWHYISDDPISNEQQFVEDVEPIEDVQLQQINGFVIWMYSFFDLLYLFKLVFIKY